MPVITQQRLQTNVFLAACDICCQPQPLVSHRALMERFGKTGAALLKKSGLSPIENLRYLSVPQGDDEVDAEIVFLGGKKHGYWGESGWVEVDSNDLRQYVLDVSWFLRWIADGFGISKRVAPRELLSGHVWGVGDAIFGKSTVPIFFVRHLRSDEAVNALLQEIKSAHRGKRVVVLSTAANDCARVAEHATVLSLPDILEQTEYFKIDLARTQALLSGGAAPADGFSNGFRNARFNGQEYSFSKTEAAIIETLHEAGRPMHKSEFMYLHSKQDDPKSVFRQNGKYKPAWNVIIKFDSKGNYWLAS
jgi:hypothetical protein